MTAMDVRDNLLTFITAGHETAALALTWTLYLLSLHPEVERRVKREIAAASGDGPVRPTHIDALGYIKSGHTGGDAPLSSRGTDRPRSPARRHAGHRACPCRNVGLRAGLCCSPSRDAVARTRSIYPSRFEPAAAQARDRYSYLPFGAGPRICIGQNFALMEAAAVLATLLSSFQLRIRPSHNPEPRLRVTLRPAGGMPMRIGIELGRSSRARNSGEDLNARFRNGCAPTQRKWKPGGV